jgi:hypothetical protein
MDVSKKPTSLTRISVISGNTCIQDMDVSKKPTSLTRISVIPGNTCSCIQVFPGITLILVSEVGFLLTSMSCIQVFPGITLILVSEEHLYTSVPRDYTNSC